LEEKVLAIPAAVIDHGILDRQQVNNWAIKVDSMLQRYKWLSLVRSMEPVNLMVLHLRWLALWMY